MALNPIVFTEKVVRSFLRYQLTAYPFASTEPGITTSHQLFVDHRQHRSPPLSEFFNAFEPFGFAMIHRSWAVNLRRVREIRPAADGGWEVKLDPPPTRPLRGAHHASFRGRNQPQCDNGGRGTHTHSQMG